MAEHPDIALARRGYEAFSNGDMATLSGLMAADVVHHVPGNHVLSGHHKGREAVLQMYRRLGEETDGTLRVDVEGLFADGRGHVISAMRMRGRRRGRTLDTRGGIFFTMVGGKVTDLDECAEDLDAENEFWAP